MSLQPITITHKDVGWHEAFLRFVPKIFPRISFRDWYQYGGWDDRYTAFALVEDDHIVASASLSRMHLLLHGQHVQGWQLGAVGTLPEYRVRGLQQQLIPRLLEHTAPDDLVFLFANHRVLDFYPRFGFSRARESLFRIERSVEPAGTPLRALELAQPDDRALLHRIAKAAEPVTTSFGAHDYGTVVLWYWSNFYRKGLRYSAEHDAIVVVDQSRALLRIYDILTSTPIDLASLLPQLISAPISEVEFGFTPTRYFPDATPRADYTDSPLFVRGPHQLPAQAFKYPMLAQR